MNKKIEWLAVPLAILGLLTGCSRSNNQDPPMVAPPTVQTTDQKLATLITAAALKGDAIESLGGQAGAPKIPAITGETDTPLKGKVDLGKLLFFTKEMSFDRTVACVTCHHPVLGGGDNVALPVGVDPNSPDLFGPGRLRVMVGDGLGPNQIPPFASNGVAGNPAMPRNSPTVFGLAFWDKSITWDGTVTSEKSSKGRAGTDSRIIAPIDLPPVNYNPVLTNTVGTRFDLNALASISYSAKFDDAMLVSAGHGMFPASVAPAMRGKGFRAGTCGSNALDVPAPSCTSGSGAAGGNYTDLDIRKLIAARFNTAVWAPYFTAAFGDANATANRVSSAIATYERTLTFTQTPWRSYVKGTTTALSDGQKRGALLFFDNIANGGANCASCHKGDFFTDENNYVLAVPQIGRGKGDANSPTDNNDDWGRAHVTGIDTDKYAYRVPTLLNVEVTGPYGHSGVFDTLEGIIRHHLNVAQSVTAFNTAIDDGSLGTRLQTAYGPPIDLKRAKDHTGFALDRLQAQRTAKLETINDVTLSSAQVADLVEFLKALTDPCTKDKACLAKWVPQTTDVLLAPATASSLNLVCPQDKNGAALIATQLCPAAP